MPPIGNQPAFSAWLQSELNKRQWSQAELARASDLSRAVINKLLNSKTFPQPHTLKCLARAFKIPVESAYRAAGLLPEIPPAEDFIAEATHLLQMIKNQRRRATALSLLKALVDEEEKEQP